MATSGPAANGRATVETWLFGAAAFAWFAALRQESLHGTDWRWLVLWLDEEGVVHAQHPGYLPLARVLRWLLAPLGLDLHAVLCVFSALGGGVAVAGVHRAAFALRGDRIAARYTAMLAMFTPSLFHFATVCELHAPFAAGMAWALWAVVRWAKGGTLRAAIVAGVLSGGATSMHATGHLMLPCVLAAVWWANRTRGGKWRFAGGAAFVLTHVVVWAGVFAALRGALHLPTAVAGFAAHPEDLAGSDNPLTYLLRSLRDMDLAAQFVTTVLVEWLLPYAPASLLTFAAFRCRALRSATVLLFVALALYLVATVALVHAYTDERGAYLLPLLLPAVLLMQEAVPRRIWPLLLALTIACGFVFRGEPGRLVPDRAFGRAAAAMAQQHKTVFFVADFPEMDGAFLADAKLDLLVGLKEYDELVAAQRTQVAFEPNSEQVAGWLALLALQAREKGAQLVVTDVAVQWLTAKVPAFGAAWPMFVQQAGAVRLPVESGIAGCVVH